MKEKIPGCQIGTVRFNVKLVCQNTIGWNW